MDRRPKKTRKVESQTIEKIGCDFFPLAFKINSATDM